MLRAGVAYYSLARTGKPRGFAGFLWGWAAWGRRQAHNTKLRIMTSPLPTHRILAPDLARGAALLGIAVANGITAWSVTGLPAAANELETYAGIIVNDSLWDKIMVVIGTLFVHVRGLPMFATLLGYGIGMILVREQHRDRKSVV